MSTIIAVGISGGAIYALFALGLVLVYKANRTLNFAQAEIGTLSTFLAWALLRTHLWWPFAVCIALLGAGLLGFAFERFIVRALDDQSRVMSVVATVSLGLLLGGIEIRIWGAGPRELPDFIGGRGLTFGGVVLPPPRLVAIGIGVVVAAVAAWFFRRTTFGLALLAASDDVDGVRLVGVRARHLSSFTWIVSSMLGGIAGIVIALSLGAFAPFFMARVMLLAFAAAVVGGMTSLAGAVAGGLFVGLAEAILGRFFVSVPGLPETLMFATIVVVLLVRPRGLLGATT